MDIHQTCGWARSSYLVKTRLKSNTNQPEQLEEGIVGCSIELASSAKPHIYMRDNTRLTARPHAFAGAVLSPKHARELTPSLAVAIATALADQNNPSASSSTHAVVPYTYVRD